jgi:predicted ribosomally synthesized peptide with SipW-like signal peptide
MKKLSRKSLVAIALVVAIGASLAIGGTLAYFTDTTDAKTNTFTVGGVDITLTEPSWDANADHVLTPGTSYDKDPTIKVEEGSQDAYIYFGIDMNKYVSLVNLMGVDAYKNHIGGLTGTYPGFGAFMTNMLTNTNLRIAVVDRWFTGINHPELEIVNVAALTAELQKIGTEDQPTTVEIVLGVKEAKSADAEYTLFTAFGMPDTVTQSMMDGDDAYYVGEGESRHSASNFNTDAADFKMTITGYAVQAVQKEGFDNVQAAWDATFGASTAATETPAP